MKDGRFEEEVLMVEAERNECTEEQNVLNNTNTLEDYENGSQVGNDEENDNVTNEQQLEDNNELIEAAENVAKSVFTMKTKQSRANTINTKYSKTSKP